MSSAADLPEWAAWVTVILVVAGSAMTLTGTIGLARLKSFYERVHAPTLGATMGTTFVLAGSIVYFSVVQSRPVLHEILIGVFVTVTTPVTLIFLVRAALYRDRIEDKDVPRLE
jgi:multicomponent K+:H+ antiporter subunit G